MLTLTGPLARDPPGLAWDICRRMAAYAPPLRSTAPASPGMAADRAIVEPSLTTAAARSSIALPFRNTVWTRSRR